MKKKAFIAASIYQLFNCINLSSRNINEYDLILMSTKGNFANFINKKKLKAIFNNIYICEYEVKKNALSNLILVIKNTYGKKTFGCLITEKYDEIYLAGTETRSKTVATKLLKEDGYFYYYEDGMASYCSVLDPLTKKKNDLIFKIMHGYYPLKRCKGMYVYEPKAVSVNPLNVECMRIEKICRDKNNLEIFKDIFMQRPFSINRKIIYLNAWYDNEKAYLLQEKVTKILIEIFGISNICIKTHPNELKNVNRISNAEYIDSMCSFEYANYFQDLSNKIIVSMVSTAAITPFMIYGDTPTVIYLNKIFQKQFPQYEENNETINLIKKIYPVAGKVLSPDSLDEYREILTNIMVESE